METVAHLIEVLLGLFLIGYVAWDVFNTVALPRPTPSVYRLARNLTRYSWQGWCWQARRMAPGQRRERWLGAFAPLLVLVLLVAWVLLLIAGFGLIDLAFGADFNPPIQSLGTAFYAAG